MGEFSVNCPQCREELVVTTDFIGQDVSCPTCNFVFKVNAPAVAPIPAPPPQVAPTVAPIPAPPQAQPPMPPGAPIPPKAKTPANPRLIKLFAGGGSLLLAFIMFAVATFVPMIAWRGPDIPGYSSGSDGSNSWSSSVTVGESSYATARNTKIIVDHAYSTAYNSKRIYDIEAFREIFFNWGYFFLISALIIMVLPQKEVKKEEA